MKKKSAAMPLGSEALLSQLLVQTKKCTIKNSVRRVTKLNQGLQLENMPP